LDSKEDVVKALHVGEPNSKVHVRGTEVCLQGCFLRLSECTVGRLVTVMQHVPGLFRIGRFTDKMQLLPIKGAEDSSVCNLVLGQPRVGLVKNFLAGCSVARDGKEGSIAVAFDALMSDVCTEFRNNRGCRSGAVNMFPKVSKSAWAWMIHSP
jgi:hypothetical protein